MNLVELRHSIKGDSSGIDATLTMLLKFFQDFSDEEKIEYLQELKDRASSMDKKLTKLFEEGQND